MIEEHLECADTSYYHSSKGTVIVTPAFSLLKISTYLPFINP